MTLQADKPILLITATPGGGKTALAVQVMQEAIAQDRPVFVMGIPELKLPHSTLPPVAEWTELRPDPDNPGLDLPFFTFPENALIVIDECQRVFRLRSSASKVPDHVAAFETVRHTGVTFVLITQSPKFIDSHIRELVGQHVHLRDVGMLGRHYYEWPEAADIKSWSTAPIKSVGKSQKNRLRSTSRPVFISSAPIRFLLRWLFLWSPLCWLLLVVGICGVDLEADHSTCRSGRPGRFSANSPVQPGPVSSGQPVSSDPVAMLQEFVPVVPGRPETAPAYDALRVVKVMPLVVGCVQTVTRCTCLNQQGLDAGLDGLQCRAWLSNPPFDAYTDRSGDDQSGQMARARQLARVIPLLLPSSPQQLAALEN